MACAVAFVAAVQAMAALAIAASGDTFLATLAKAFLVLGALNLGLGALAAMGLSQEPARHLRPPGAMEGIVSQMSTPGIRGLNGSISRRERRAVTAVLGLSGAVLLILALAVAALGQAA
jgi:hypothetical protein